MTLAMPISEWPIGPKGTLHAGALALLGGSASTGTVVSALGPGEAPRHRAAGDDLSCRHAGAGRRALLDGDGGPPGRSSRPGDRDVRGPRRDGERPQDAPPSTGCAAYASSRPPRRGSPSPRATRRLANEFGNGGRGTIALLSKSATAAAARAAARPGHSSRALEVKVALLRPAPPGDAGVTAHGRIFNRGGPVVDSAEVRHEGASPRRPPVRACSAPDRLGASSGPAPLLQARRRQTSGARRRPFRGDVGQVRSTRTRRPARRREPVRVDRAGHRHRRAGDRHRHDDDGEVDPVLAPLEAPVRQPVPRRCAVDGRRAREIRRSQSRLGRPEVGISDRERVPEDEVQRHGEHQVHEPEAGAEVEESERPLGEVPELRW